MKRALVVLLIALGGCLSVPEGEEPMCKVTEDCDHANGEVCESGICYGNPPAGPFAAIVTPPADRRDLVAGEHPVLPITQDGWLGTIQLPESVMFTGQLRARCEAPLVCDGSLPVGATITVERPAQFAGGPTIRSSVTIEPGDGSFQLVVPRTGETDRGFSVTVVPSGRDNGPSENPTTAQILPPLRTEISVTETLTGQVIELGGANLKSVSGYLKTPTGGGLAGYRVVAMGRWDPLSAPQEVSTVYYTGTDGKFMVVLSAGLVDTIAIKAEPHAENPARLPTLHLPGLSTVTSSSNIEITMPTNLGTATPTTVSVTTIGGSGGSEPVRGARVVVKSRIDPVIGSAYATYEDEATSDDNGIATLELLNGDMVQKNYRISVVPPAGSTASSLYDVDYSMGPAEFVLPRRIAIRGIVSDFDGQPLKDVSVTVRPALRFTWSLPPGPQSFVSAIPPATVVTPETGEFVLFVDPIVAEVWGHYDLVYEPTEKTRAPSWSETVEIPRDASVTTVTLPTTVLPDAAFVHGEVVDPSGELVKDAEVKLFLVETNLALCDSVPYEPARCPIPARLMSRGASDSDGHVRLTLPR